MENSTLDTILIVDCGSTKTPHIEEVIYDFSDYETISFFELNQETANKYKGIIISGAPILITEEDMSPYLLQLDWIKSYEKPILGICFGHQIIGLLYGAYPDRMKEDNSFNEIESITDCPLLERIPTVFEMQENHCESISIPSEFQLVATSDDCINEVMQHETKPFFGVQFHPEVSGNMGYVLLENFAHICESHKNEV